MDVEVLVPWMGGCPWRERALEFVRGRNDWPVTVAEAPPGPWSKGVAATPAVEASSAEVLVIADADVFTDGLDAAVDAVAKGAPWAIPHRLVWRLSETGTDAVLAGADWRGQPLAQRQYPGFEGGGIVVVRRSDYLRAPLDGRFVGFGGEDESWSCALTTMVGQPWRGEADLIHLWHPPQERMSRRWGSEESKTLALRYHAANGHPMVMRDLIAEEVEPCPSPA